MIGALLISAARLDHSALDTASANELSIPAMCRKKTILFTREAAASIALSIVAPASDLPGDPLFHVTTESSLSDSINIIDPATDEPLSNIMHAIAKDSLATMGHAYDIAVEK